MAKLASLDGSVAEYILPPEQIGGDQIITSLPAKSADIEIQRNGVTISLRPWRNLRTWRVNYNCTPQTNISALRVYHGLRVFKLYPVGAGLYYVVKWVGLKFEPEYLGPGLFRLAATWEEVQT